MICITGVPGSGKSTVCGILREQGFDCRNVLDLEGANSCLEGDEMDIDCLREKAIPYTNTGIIVEGHYSHILQCSMIFILERGEDIVSEALKQRGYPHEKISSNIDAIRSDIIYQEALESAPAPRIHRIVVHEGNPGAAAETIMKYAASARKD